MESIEHGYSCAAGQLDNGRFAAVNSIEDHDREFTRDSEQRGSTAKSDYCPEKAMTPGSQKLSLRQDTWYIWKRK